MIAVPNDREPGYTLISKPALTRVHFSFLSSKNYKPISNDAVHPQSWGPSYERICKAVAKLEESKSLYNSMMKSATTHGTTPLTKLQLTCKTLKSELAWRNIHASSGNSFTGLSLWLCKVFSAATATLEHILPTRESFVRWAKNIRLGKNDYMLRIDIKHFYMSGKPEEIAELACETLQEGPQRDTYFGAVLWLLTNQYIASNADSNMSYCQVVRGTGMGLQASGPLADAAFFVKAERDWCVRPAVAESYGIREYVRFRDDLFIVASDRNLTRAWYGELRRRADPVFELVVEEVSNSNVSMLSLDVSIHNRGLRVKPKPPPCQAPLGTDSAHHPAIHRSWPVACLRNIRFLCSHIVDIEAAEDEYILRFVQAGADLPLLRSLQRNRFHMNSDRERTRRARGEVHLVMKFHPAFEASGFTRKLDHFLRNPVWHGILGQAGLQDFCNLAVTWKNAGAHLQMLLREPGRS